MFFEPAPAVEDAAPGGSPQLPPWLGPPAREAGILLAIQRVVARSTNVVVFLTAIRAFTFGCMLELEIATRQAGMPEDDWWELQAAVHLGSRGFRGSQLPDRLLRLGVRYADGTKATTLGRPWGRDSRGGPPEGSSKGLHEEPPEAPLLMWWPGGSGVRGGGGDLGFNHFGLWLWPLPPAEHFEFAVEWPFGGIGLTFAELDGAAIVAAASRPFYYWPESQ